MLSPCKDMVQAVSGSPVGKRKVGDIIKVYYLNTHQIYKFVSAIKTKMSIPILTVKGYQPEEIKKLLTSNESFVVALRLYLVYQVSLSYSSRKLAEIHDISFKQITTWVHRFEAEGVEGLKNRSGRGRKSLLSKEKMQRIKTLVLKGASVRSWI